MSRSSSESSTKSYSVEKSEQDWKKQLTPAAYVVLREAGTERPGSSNLNNLYPDKGVFKCAGCAHPLYTANSKFKCGTRAHDLQRVRRKCSHRSSCGWPCFDQVIYTQEGGCHVGVNIHGGAFEVVCNNCGGHLGNVFYGEGCTPKNERH
ncbi:unnamed protein product [Polarella glacialis]|uniref:MsrB domain-containing protein n=2 Tax=Polarella glacialis TaxID=89957 RepID=A0A813G4R9_POLGL|nr:unnamed protein product [Polarella glacialis]